MLSLAFIYFHLCVLCILKKKKNVLVPLITILLSDFWQQLELASELESDLENTVDWGSKWLADFNTGKTELVSFDWSNKTGAIDVKIDGSALEEKSSFMMLGLTFTS